MYVQFYTGRMRMRWIFHAKYAFYLVYYLTHSGQETFFSRNFDWIPKILISFSLKTFNLGAKDVKICGPSKIDCTITADNTIFQTDAYDECNCLPACESINYDVDSSQADYDLVNYYSKSGFKPEYSYQKYEIYCILNV